MIPLWTAWTILLGVINKIMYTLNMQCPNRKCIEYYRCQIGDCSYYQGKGCLHENISRHKKYHKWGLSPAQQQKLLLQQHNQCAICKRKMKPPQLDHNHKTKKARGYLCRTCNVKLTGLDDKQFRKAALAYLTNPPAEQFYT